MSAVRKFFQIQTCHYHSEASYYIQSGQPFFLYKLGSAKHDFLYVLDLAGSGSSYPQPKKYLLKDSPGPITLEDVKPLRPEADTEDSKLPIICGINGDSLAEVTAQINTALKNCTSLSSAKEFLDVEQLLAKADMIHNGLKARVAEEKKHQLKSQTIDPRKQLFEEVMGLLSQNPLNSRAVRDKLMSELEKGISLHIENELTIFNLIEKKLRQFPDDEILEELYEEMREGLQEDEEAAVQKAEKEFKKATANPVQAGAENQAVPLVLVPSAPVAVAGKPFVSIAAHQSGDKERRPSELIIIDSEAPPALPAPRSLKPTSLPPGVLQANFSLPPPAAAMMARLDMPSLGSPNGAFRSLAQSQAQEARAQESSLRPLNTPQHLSALSPIVQSVARQHSEMPAQAAPALERVKSKSKSKPKSEPKKRPKSKPVPTHDLEKLRRDTKSKSLELVHRTIRAKAETKQSSDDKQKGLAGHTKGILVRVANLPTARNKRLARLQELRAARSAAISPAKIKEARPKIAPPPPPPPVVIVQPQPPKIYGNDKYNDPLEEAVKEVMSYAHPDDFSEEMERRFGDLLIEERFASVRRRF